ncbi:MAG: ATP-binding protein [Hyphomicrobiales bacterium]
MVERSRSGALEYSVRGNDKTDADNYRASNDLTVFEARFNTVLKTASDGIIVTNDRARVLMYNKSCEALFGYQAGEIVGRYATLLMPPRHARTDIGSIIDYVKNGGDDVIGTTHQVYGQHKDGSLIPIELTIGEADTPAGRQFIGVVKDLRAHQTNQNRIDELQQQVLKLSRHNAIEEVNAGMAHEINQPLTALTLYLQAIEKKNKVFDLLDKDMSDILSKAMRETERAGKIIQRMRWFGKYALMQDTSANIATLIQDAFELTTVGNQRSGLEININIEENLPDLRIDAIQIQQIFVNLIRNAIEAVADHKKATIWINAKYENDFVAISVADSGSGIPEEARGQLFCTFASNKDTGMGLGLAISNTIAENHGGHFDVDYGGNEQGATFTFHLPVNQKG